MEYEFSSDYRSPQSLMLTNITETGDLFSMITICLKLFVFCVFGFCFAGDKADWKIFYEYNVFVLKFF